MSPENLESATPPASPPRPRPWVTWTMVGVCCALFVLVHQRAIGSPSWLGQWGYWRSGLLWTGGPALALWGGLTSAFLHIELWHFGANLFWLWVLGRTVERSLGSPRYAAVALMGAVVASAAQMAWGGSTGIGSSGMLYAIFGVALVCRKRLPGLAKLVTPNFIVAWLTWMVACALVLPNRIGNGAHIGGFIFGGLAGHFLMTGRSSKLRWGVTAGLVLITAFPLMFCPWQPSWYEWVGHDLEASDQSSAQELFETAAASWPKRPYPWRQLVLLRAANGDEKGANAALAHLRTLQPIEAKRLEERLRPDAGR